VRAALAQDALSVDAAAGRAVGRADPAVHNTRR
jgi:hypothetical protein